MASVHRVRLMVPVLLAASLPSPAQPPATRPSPPAGVDYVADLFDLYYQGRERDRFFAAAGVDGELSEEEFAKAAEKPESFVRPYDRWHSAVVFDADHDRRLNWVEAEQYRLAIRARVMRLFDKNKDGRLTGAEREAAKAYLASGMGRPRLSEAPPAPPPSGERPKKVEDLTADPAWPQRWETLRAEYDADRDGKLSEEEQAKLHEGLRAHYQGRLLEQFDKDASGALDQKEQAALEAQERAEAAKWRQEWEETQFDANKDGHLDEAERAAMEKHFARQRLLAQKRRQEWLKRWDTDGDGQLSQAERDEVTKDLRRRADLQRREMDADHDGRITAKEIRAYRKKLFEALRRERQQ